MWKTALDRMLRRLLTWGELQVEWPDGEVRTYGPGGGISSSIRLTREEILRPLCLNPVLAIGEGYMDGSIDIETDEMYDLLTLLVRNQQKGGGLPAGLKAYGRYRDAVRRFMQHNDPRKSRNNVAHHYDISDDLYRLFLDTDMQYSCAYFARPDMTLEEAQEAKKHHIAHKLMIEPGMRVLDIGCGWGGMALTLARDYGARVVGVTLSENQLKTARERAEAEGLSDKVEFRLIDYRDLSDSFDRIVSVGMFEHVGLPHFAQYFDKVGDLLKEDGVALIHTIGRVAPPGATSPWIAKYIFPGGYVPSMSDVAPVLERSGLWTTDMEILRGHYGPTIHHWHQRFEANLDKVREMYDERFIRMWRFYLIACEMAFEEQYQAVFQYQLTHRQHAVPATRDYMYQPDQAEMLRAAE